ncbi:MAG: AI-2E family transporter [archaeon]|uniref:Putative PurR-regulated permease PerM n=1 Tax=Methanobrevibacter gottschalkii DSM 11977 TaxID=1122229 RepID=A0A3N5B5H2_9EURY|nr:MULTISPECIES: AI-2E family transporter [Methanobrevibacter]MCQ2970159.1 AI-2E family transporter [archaeon]OEC93804.1 AI-2E family transporter [Methanobrevibacter sp. A27]RPF52644.1 putative PurR-regulated permease PerM [Methanobrevibacter gottschalkii DSM 11977]
MGIEIEKYLNFPVLLICFLLITSLIFIFPALKMIVLGAILAYLVRPVAFKIQSKLKFSSVSILIAMVIVLIPLIALVGYISYELSSVASTMLASSSTADINESILKLITYLHIDVNPNEISQSIISSFETIASYVMNYGVSFLGKFANLTLDLFILVCSVFYFVRDGDNCLNFIKSFVPEGSVEFFDKTVDNIKDVLKSIFYGHFLTAVIIGIFGCIGYSILGYPFGIFLGVLTGILQLIPIFGPWPIYWTLFFIDALSGNYPRAIMVLLFGFFLSTIDMYIRPALSSHYADIHPLILLVGFLAGPLVYGIVGFIVGPLILGITYTVLDSYRKEYLMRVE